MVFSAITLKILLVEDNAGDAVLIEEYLKEEIRTPVIHHVLTFGGAKEKLSGAEVYDAILLDLSLPDATAKQLVGEMLRLAPAIPVIILTGYGDKDFGIQALSHGISDYLMKDGLSAAQLYRSIAYSIERKKIALKFNESEEKHRKLFQNSPLPMWVYNPESLRFLDVNEAAISHYGYSREEFMSMSIRDIRPASEVKHLEKIAALSKTKGGAFEGIFSHYKKDGSLIHVNVRSSSIDFNGIKARLVLASDITEKIKAEIKIKESNDRYNLVAKATSDAIWDYDAVSNKTFISGSGYKYLFGYNIVNDFTEDGFWESRLHPEEKERVLNDMYKAITDKNTEQCSLEYRMLKANGKYAYVRDRFFIMRENGQVVRMIGAKQDITRQKEEEQHLRLLESVITNTKDAAIITDADTSEQGPKIVYVNEAFIKMTGYQRDEIIGQTPRMFQGQATEREKLNKIRAAMEEKQACDVEVMNYTKSGSPYWVEMSIAPVMDVLGRATHFIAIERDITNRKTQEQEREKLIHELTQNNIDLRQFSYITSHNLRGPIASLLGLCSLIDLSTVEDKTLKQILEGVKKATFMFDETLRDLSTVLNIRDRTSIPKEDLMFFSVFEKSLAQLKTLVSECKAEIESDFSAAPIVNYNKAYLESIFSNLITNAVKYRSPDRRLQVSITTEQAGEWIVMKFKDNGLGIDTVMHKEKIFRLHQRFHNHTEGKGLGLFLVKSQLESLGGTIDLESKEGDGTTFILKFKK